MVFDVAHASSATIDDVLALATRPVVASHTGVRGGSRHARNLPDDQVRGIAATGGLVGIGFWPIACGGRDAAAIARSIVHAIELAGVEHVGLGSDFDGAVQTPFDATGMAALTEALLAERLSSDDDIARGHGRQRGPRPGGCPLARRRADSIRVTSHPARPCHGRVSAETPRDHPQRRSGRRRAGHRRARHDRVALEATRLHLSLVRDLRRHQRGLGLRAARRRAQEQRQAGVVADHGPGARRHRRPRRRDPHASPGLGDVRPRRIVQRPAGRMPDRPPAVPARRAAGR